MNRIFGFLAVAFIAFGTCAATSVTAQVAPAAYTSGRAIGIGAGFSSYDLDYGPGRRMEGAVVRASVGIFHGLGVDGSARSIFMFTPASLTRMQQSTFLGGVYYEAPQMFHFRPFVRAAGGLGLIEFPSRDPAYTRDTYTVYAPSGGVEIPIVPSVFLRAEYEYQYWREFHGPHYLNPQGYTVGVTYYLSGMRHKEKRIYR